MAQQLSLIITAVAIRFQLPSVSNCLHEQGRGEFVALQQHPLHAKAHTQHHTHQPTAHCDSISTSACFVYHRLPGAIGPWPLQAAPGRVHNWPASCCSPCRQLPVVVYVVGVELVAEVDGWLSHQLILHEPTKAASSTATKQAASQGCTRARSLCDRKAAQTQAHNTCRTAQAHMTHSSLKG